MMRTAEINHLGRMFSSLRLFTLFFLNACDKIVKYGKGGIPMEHQFHAAQLFLDGYNCAQAIAVAFADVTGLDESFSAKMASSFGGGIGRLREVCGAVSGMVMVAGLLYGYDASTDEENKKLHYQRVQELALRFREEVGSMICREILKNPPSDPNPTPRTAEFYKQRPCTHMVMVAARILDEYIENNPPQGTEAK